jgi:hypothetical protein
VKSIMNLNLGFGSHDLFTVVLHSITYIPVFDNVVDVIYTRIT